MSKKSKCKSIKSSSKLPTLADFFVEKLICDHTQRSTWAKLSGTDTKLDTRKRKPMTSSNFARASQSPMNFKKLDQNFLIGKEMNDKSIPTTTKSNKKAVKVVIPEPP
jgi:tRNA(Leu) C34 or U34 (ribose-2'-O)-methylase TrmL